MKRILSILLLITFGCSPTKKTPAEQSQEFRALYRVFWDYSLKQDPILATLQGFHQYNDQLPTPSIEQYAKDQQFYRSLLTKAHSLKSDNLSPFETINKDVFIRMLNNKTEGITLGNHYIPWDARGGFHTGYAELPVFSPFNNIKDYENYISRLNKSKDYFSAYIKIASEGLQKGYIPQKKPMEGFSQTVDAIISKNIKSSIFYKPFLKFPKTINSEQQKRLIKLGTMAIKDVVNPAYKNLNIFWTTKYKPKMKPTYSVYSQSKGKERYKYFIKYHTSLDLTPDQIHQIGLGEVIRIRNEMKAVIASVGHKGNIKSFTKKLRTTPKFFPKTKKELLSKVKERLNQMDKKLPDLFGKLPKTPYGIKEIPAYKAAKETTAYYWPPSANGDRIGYYYVNTSQLNQRPLYEIEALSFHEAVPGHHLQLSLQKELKDLPKFRNMERATVFVEGWALYAESIAKSVGFYKDPYSDFGRLTYEMWRACRLVVDTGIHAKAWSRSMAIEFMLRNTALSKKNIEVEVDRYITWPGQALAYKMGELKIKELRKSAEKQLGQKFDLKEFHDTVLANGSIPISTLEKQVNKWIKQKI